MNYSHRSAKKHRPKRSFRRYRLAESPFFRMERRSDLARLLGLPLVRLMDLAKNKDRYYVEKRIDDGIKPRIGHLPTKKLYGVHARLQGLLSRIELPGFILCPRKGASPLNNAVQHAGASHITTADVKSFYPSTTEEHIFRFFRYRLEMSEDNSRILARLATFEGRLPVGSKLSPHLAALVHLDVFEEANAVASAANQPLSVWVDDVTWSGEVARRDVLCALRRGAKRKGLEIHKVQRAAGNQRINITGTEICGDRIGVANKSNLKLKAALEAFKSAADCEKISLGQKCIGIVRYHKRTKKLAGRDTEPDNARLRWLEREIGAAVQRLNEAKSERLRADPSASRESKPQISPVGLSPF